MRKRRLIYVCAMLVVLGVVLLLQQKEKKSGEIYSSEMKERTESVESESEETESEKIAKTQMPEESVSHEETISTETEVIEESEVLAETMFYGSPLTEEIKTRITGVSFPANSEGIQIQYEELSYLHLLYYDFDGNVQQGELICNKKIEEDLLDIFKTLYDNAYPIEKIRLVDEYGGDDDASMEDNNTSCFNYRMVMGTDHLSNHSFGLAIDVNPFYNPYITKRNGKTVVSPEQSVDYADRSKDFAHKIDENDLCYQLFTQHGFFWGGNWINSKDYQHFEKKL